MPTSVVPAALDTRAQHLGRLLYVNNIRAVAHRLPGPGTSGAVYSNHYTSSFAEVDVLAAKLCRLRNRVLRRGRPDPDELRGRPRYRDWEA